MYLLMSKIYYQLYHGNLKILGLFFFYFRLFNTCQENILYSKTCLAPLKTESTQLFLTLSERAKSERANSQPGLYCVYLKKFLLSTAAGTRLSLSWAEFSAASLSGFPSFPTKHYNNLLYLRESFSNFYLISMYSILK